MPSILSTLQENMRTIRAALDRIDSLTIPCSLADHLHPPTYRDIVIDCCRCEGSEHPLPQLRAMHLSFDIAGWKRLLQDVVDQVGSAECVDLGGCMT